MGSQANYAVLIHGGASDSWIGDATSYSATRLFLGELMNRLSSALEGGAAAVDVAVDAVAALEDYPEFNAGKGAAINHDGLHELEAGVVRGSDSCYRAAVCLRNTKNPVRLAKAMLSSSRPVLISGAGGDELADILGLEKVPNGYFTTEKRHSFWSSRRKGLDEHGTVGAVVLDVHGNLAAANSTGGTMFKHAGRVGDTAILGAGLYADGNLAIACGGGEPILASMLSSRIVNRYRSGQPLDKAVSTAILEATQLFPDTSCGVIAVSSHGEQVVHCNSRIFTVARGGWQNLPPLDAVVPCTIPVITPLCVYEDNVVRVGFLKHPTVPFQMHFQLLQGQSLAKMDEVAFTELFLTLKDVAGILAEVAAVPHVAIKTAPAGDAGCLFPVKQHNTGNTCVQRPREEEEEEEEEPTRLKRVAFETGYTALLFRGRVEVYRPEEVEVGLGGRGAGGPAHLQDDSSRPASFFALSGDDFCGACKALYGALTLGLQEALQIQSWSLAAPIPLEHEDASGAYGAWAVLRDAYSPGPSWPAPSAFIVDGTAPLSTDLGPRVSDSQLQSLCDYAVVVRARLELLHG